MKIEVIVLLVASAALLMGSLGPILARRLRRRPVRQACTTIYPPPRVPLPSREAFLETATPTIDRSCMRCDHPISAGAVMWTRTHGGLVRYLHQGCADEQGEALPWASRAR